MASYFREKMLEGVPERQGSALRNQWTLSPEAQRAAFVENLGAIIPHIERPRVWGEKTPQGYMSESVTKVFGHLNPQSDNHPHAILTMPDGADEVEVLLTLLNGAITKNPDDTLNVTPTLFVTPNPQEAMAIGQKARHRFPGLDAGIVRGGRERIRPFTVITYDKLKDFLETGEIKAGDVANIILHKAHHGLAEERKHHLESFIGKANIIASSATPVYDFNKSLYQLLGRENEVVSLPYEYFVDNLLLAQLRNEQVHLNVEYDTKAYPTQAQRREIALYASAISAYELLAKQIQDNDGRIEPTIMFYNRVEDAEKVYAYFKDRFDNGKSEVDRMMRKAYGDSYSYFSDMVSSSSEHAHGKKNHIDGVFDVLRRRRLGVVFNVGMFIERDKIPAIYNVFNVGGSDSFVKLINQDSQASLTDPDNKRKLARVNDFVISTKDKKGPGEPEILSGGLTFSDALTPEGQKRFFGGATAVTVDMDQLIKSVHFPKLNELIQSEQAPKERKLLRPRRALNEAADLAPQEEVQIVNPVTDAPVSVRVTEIQPIGNQDEEALEIPRIHAFRRLGNPQFDNSTEPLREQRFNTSPIQKPRQRRSGPVRYRPYNSPIKITRYPDISYGKPTELKKLIYAQDARDTYGEKTEEWRSVPEWQNQIVTRVAEEYGKRFNVLANLIKSHHPPEKAAQEQVMTITVGAEAYEVKTAYKVDETGKLQFVIHKDAEEFLKHASFAMLIHDTDWVMETGLYKELGLDPKVKNAGVEAFLEKLKVAYAAQVTPQTKGKGMKIVLDDASDTEFMVSYKRPDTNKTFPQEDGSRSRYGFCVHGKSMKNARNYCRLESRYEVFKDTTITEGQILTIFNNSRVIEGELQKLSREYDSLASTPGALVNLHGLSARKVLTGQSTSMLAFDTQDFLGDFAAYIEETYANYVDQNYYTANYQALSEVETSLPADLLAQMATAYTAVGGPNKERNVKIGGVPLRLVERQNIVKSFDNITASDNPHYNARYDVNADKELAVSKKDLAKLPGLVQRWVVNYKPQLSMS